MITKYEDHSWKEWKEKLPSFMKFFNHIEKNHNKKQVNEKDKEVEDDKYFLEGRQEW